MSFILSLARLSLIFLCVTSLVVDARAVETTITLYRVGGGGHDPNQNVVSKGPAFAIGIGPDGGTTYSQPAAYSAISTVVAPPASLVSIFDYTTTVGNVYVEKDRWVYQSVAASSGSFNLLEQNCTLSDAGNSGSCVEVDRQVVSSITTALTTTYNAPAVGWYTFTRTSTVPDPTFTIHSAPSGARRFESMTWWGCLPAIIVAIQAS